MPPTTGAPAASKSVFNQFVNGTVSLQATKKANEKVLLKIGDKWVNVTAWKKTHPGGAIILERVNNTDVTEMFNSLHSDQAKAKVKKMMDVGEPAGYIKESAPNATTLSFRALRRQLEADGWFVRNWLWDLFYIIIMVSLVTGGTLVKDSHPMVAVLMIGLGMQQAGWIGHDYVHGRGEVSYVLGRVIGSLINGFSSNWWSDKHNTHHCHTNQVGIDEDIAMDPILHLHIPTKQNDYWFRKYQHYYYHVLYSLLYYSWRTHSAIRAWKDKDPKELSLLALNYAWLYYLGPSVALGSILVGGSLVAEVVTATHQSEEMIPGISYQFAEDQFRTTRDVVLETGLANWFWGGMQWQLEHHLFPTMPKYRYPAVSKLLKKWAKENSIEYRASSSWEILKLNYNTMKKNAVMSVEEFNAANPHPHVH